MSFDKFLNFIIEKQESSHWLKSPRGQLGPSAVIRRFAKRSFRGVMGIAKRTYAAPTAWSTAIRLQFSYGGSGREQMR
jgi:hypothetical protein